jgi:hypothetical protein
VDPLGFQAALSEIQVLQTAEDNFANSHPTFMDPHPYWRAFFKAVAHAGDAWGFDQASENLHHYLDGSGHLKTIPPEWLRQWDVIERKVQSSRANLLKKAILSARGVKCGDAIQFDDAILASWIFIPPDKMGSAWDPTSHKSLFYASNQSELSVVADLTLYRDPESDSLRIQGSIEYLWRDDWDWLEGANFDLLFLRIDDDEAEKLEAGGRAKPFPMGAVWTEDIDVVVEFNSKIGGYYIPSFPRTHPPSGSQESGVGVRIQEAITP